MEMPSGATSSVPCAAKHQQLPADAAIVLGPIVNSLELHIPIPIPTPPTPLPIVIAYPVANPIQAHISVADSGLVLESVPPESGALADDIRVLALEDGYEYVDGACQEDIMAGNNSGSRWEKEKTYNLFSALNLPLNINKLRFMRATGKQPSPLLKLRFRRRLDKRTQSSEKESGAISGGSGQREEAEGETEIERVQGESWYLPSARSSMRRRVEHQRVYERQEELMQDDDVEAEFRMLPFSDLEHTPRFFHPYSHLHPSESTLDATTLGAFPAPPSIIAPVPPMPTSTPVPDKHARPLGYMYAPSRPLARAVSCKSCGSGSPSPSTSGTSTLAPTPRSVPTYAYDLITPFPPAHAAHQPVYPIYAEIKRSVSTPLTAAPMVGSVL